MVKEAVYTRNFEHCKVKDFWEILYADGSSARAYHREADKDENAKVEDWEGNIRTVTFSMPMQIPPVIAKFIGTNVIPVKEIQKAETDEDSNLHITSIPNIGVPGGNKFVAVAKLLVSNTDFGCKVEARVVCTAKGIIGLNGMIEGIMAEQSKASLKTYLTFCHKRCQARLSENALDHSNDLASDRSDSTAFDQFFDAQEMLSRSTSMSSMVSEVDIAQLQQSPAEELIDTAAILKLLDTLDGRLAHLSSDLSHLRALLPPSTFTPGSLPLNGHSSDHHQPSNRGRRGSNVWLSGFSCGAAVATCIVAVIFRRRLFPGGLPGLKLNVQ